MASRVPTIRDMAKLPTQAPKTKKGTGMKSLDKGDPKTKSPKGLSPKQQWNPFSKFSPQDKDLYKQEPVPDSKRTRSRSPASRSPRSKSPATHVSSTKPPDKQPQTTHHVTPKATTTHPPTTQVTTTHPPSTMVTTKTTATSHPPTTQTTTTTIAQPPKPQPVKTVPQKTQPPITKTTTPRIPAIQVTAPRGPGYYKFKEDSINCPICTKHYDQPRMLPCLHSFCHSCLVFYIQDGRYNDSSKGFPCPCCRKIAYSAGMSKTRPDKWAELFPVNSLLADLVDLNALKKGTKVCDPCQKNKTKSDVHTYCRNCRNALCERCAKTHRGLRSCKNHIVLSVDEFEAAISSLKVDEEFCTKHEGKVMEHFCQPHAKLCCSSCIAEEHRQCDKVVPVSEAAQKVRETNEIPKLESALAKYNDHLNSIMQNRSSQLKKLENKKGKIMEEFLDIKRKIILQLEKMEKDLKTKLEQTHKQETKKIHDEVETCQEIQSGVVNASELLQIADNHGADSQVVDTVENVKHECVYFENKIGDINRQVRTVDYHLALDKNLEQMAKKLDQFGRIDVKTSPSGLSEPPKIANTLGIQSLQGSKAKNTNEKGDKKSVKPSEYAGGDADEIAEFDARCNDDAEDSTCWFTGAQFLHDGRILLVDRTNKKLKMFSKDFNAISELLFYSKPWDVTVISNKEVAVSLPEECRIQFVSVAKDSLSFVRTISTEDPCFGIHYANEKIMMVAYDGNPPNLTILTPDGEELTYVSVDEDGFTLFSKPIYVTSTPNGSEIYVTDERLGSVINLSENGELKFTYSAMDLGHAAGIALDNDANVYVCANTSNTVQVLNSKGDRIKILANGEDISYPRAIAYEPREKRLLVTQGDKDMVKIYSLAGSKKRNPE